MKKSSIVIVVVVLIGLFAGTLFIARSIKTKSKGSTEPGTIAADIQDNLLPDGDKDLSFGEYKYTIAGDTVITAKYIKSGSTIRIYAIYPAEDKNTYDIASDGGAALYLAKDGHIWILYNSGKCKKVTPDRYESIEKSEVQNNIPGYVWADRPAFTETGTVRFISNLPDTGSTLKKSIWEISMINGTMKKVYTLSSEDYTILGYREDSRLMILDGSSISCINLKDNSIESIDVSDKYVIAMSPDGTQIIYVKRDKSGNPDYSSLYKMDSYGANQAKLPGIEGYKASSAGIWNYNNMQYAYIAKAPDAAGDKIAVIEFKEDITTVTAYVPYNDDAPDNDIKLPDNSKLKWTDSELIVVDTGDSLIKAEIK